MYINNIVYRIHDIFFWRCALLMIWKTHMYDTKKLQKSTVTRGRCCTLRAKRSSLSPWGRHVAVAFLCVAVELGDGHCPSNPTFHPLKSTEDILKDFSWVKPDFGGSTKKDEWTKKLVLIWLYHVASVITKSILCWDERRAKYIMLKRTLIVTSWPPERLSFFVMNQLGFLTMTTWAWLCRISGEKRQRFGPKTLTLIRFEDHPGWRSTCWYFCRTFIHKIHRRAAVTIIFGFHVDVWNEIYQCSHILYKYWMFL